MCLNKKFTKEEWNLNESLRISNEIERISNKSLQISYITNWNEFWRNLYEFETSSLRRMNGFWTNLYGFPTKLNESVRISNKFERILNESLRIFNEIERILNGSLRICNEIERVLNESLRIWTGSSRRMNGFWTNLYGFPTKLNEFRTDFQRNWTNSERISTDFQRNWMILKKPYIKNPSERNFNGFLETKTTKIERNLKTVFPLKKSILNGITTKILTTFERNLNGLISLKIRSSFVNQSFVFRRLFYYFK